VWDRGEVVVIYPRERRDRRGEERKENKAKLGSFFQEESLKRKEEK
jgi:hypothetical protein